MALGGDGALGAGNAFRHVSVTAASYVPTTGTRGNAIRRVGVVRVRRHGGRPLASDGFLSTLEKKLGRPPRALPPAQAVTRVGARGLW